MFLELLYSLSCFCPLPGVFNLYYKNNFICKNEIMALMLLQTLIGFTSDSYSLMYNNYLSHILNKIDRIAVCCISLPSLFYVSHINQLKYINNIQYLLSAILFWYNGHTIHLNNKINNNKLYKLILWNHISWHYFMGLYIYKLTS